MTAEPERVNRSEQPVEARLAERLSRRAAQRGRPRSTSVEVLRLLADVDREAYLAVAGWSAPVLDRPLRELSRFANFSKPWTLVAAILATTGGRSGRRAALTGVAATAITSLVVNQPMKLAGNRARPDREGAGVPSRRWVRMPTSTSFPSGHSASAAAFAVALGDVRPALRLPLVGAAAAVAFSRVYTGVHYPGDVLVGATVGALVGRATSRTTAHLTARL